MHRHTSGCGRGIMCGSSGIRDPCRLQFIGQLKQTDCWTSESLHDGAPRRPRLLLVQERYQDVEQAIAGMKVRRENTVDHVNLQPQSES